MKTLFSFFLAVMLLLGFQVNAQSNDYKRLWNSVKNYESKGLPKSAGIVNDSIFKMAVTTHNYPQFLKSFIYKMRLRTITKDEDFSENMMQAEKMLDSVPFPVKPILHSMVAEMYWWYYQNNRYTFYNRSKLGLFVPTDISTWDLNRIINKVIAHYKQSLMDSARLKFISMNDFRDIIDQTNYDKEHIKPTLYDFLALRAVDFFKSEDPGLTLPGEEFTMNQESFFLPADSFARLHIETPDTIAFKYYAISLFRDLIAAHLKDTIPEALVDIDLKRLEFVNEASSNEEKDSLYLQSLIFLEEKSSGRDVAATIGLIIADKLCNMGEKYHGPESDLHRWDKLRAEAKCMQLLETFPAWEAAVYQILERIKKKDLSMTIERENIPNEPFRALVNYQNTDTLFVRVIPFSEEMIESIREAYKKKIADTYVEWDKFLYDYLKVQHHILNYNIALLNAHDFQKHSTEIKIPALDAGYYFIIAAADSLYDWNTEKVTAYGMTTVTNLSYIQRPGKKDGGNDFYVLNRKTGMPVSGVKVECWSQKYNYNQRDTKPEILSSLLSDANGFFKVKHTDHQNFWINLSYGKDHLTSREPDAYYPEGTFYNFGYNPQDNKEIKSFFFTDRSIYRPGQTIYFKGIVFETDGNRYNKLKTGFKSTVSFFDVNNQKVNSIDLTTNEYGSFNGSFTAPTNRLNGQMRIENSSGSIFVSVEDYKRPKFEVKFDTIHESYKLGAMVTLSGFAESYSAARLTDAKVSYRVIRETRYDGWWCWWRPQPVTHGKEIIHGTCVTDIQGKYSISFKAIPDVSVAVSTDPTFVYKVSVDVSDINGETHSTQKEITASYKALVLNVDIPEKLDRKSSNSFGIQSTNLNGDRVASRGQLTILKLKSPEKVFRERKWPKPDFQVISQKDFYHDFPLDPYADELDFSAWKTEKVIMESTFDTDRSGKITLPDLKNWNQGMYEIILNSADIYGTPVIQKYFFTVYDKSGGSLPYFIADWYHPVKDTGEPGDVAEILAGTGFEKSKVLVEVETQDSIVKQDWVRLNGKQRLFKYTLKASYRGNIGIHYTFIRNNRMYAHSTTIKVPYTNKMLQLNFETFRNKLQPGEKDQWKITVKGKNGDVAAAEMVATLYDASLDVFRPQAFNFNLWQSVFPENNWNSGKCFEAYDFKNRRQDVSYNTPWNKVNDYQLKWFGYGYHCSLYFEEDSAIKYKQVSMSYEATSSVSVSIRGVGTMKKEDGFAMEKNNASLMSATEPPIKPQSDLSAVNARTNLNETAFFYPNLQTNERGEIIINFTIPEALTRWKMLGFAHTKDLSYGFTEKELVTQKTLMVTPNAPRFFREGDTLTFTSKITSLSDNKLKGNAKLMLFDGLTMKPVDLAMNNSQSTQSFTLVQKGNVNLNWNIVVPLGLQAVTYRVVAQAGDFSDGEESTLPVLTNTMLVTETLPLPVRGHESKTFVLDKLLHNTSTTLRNHKLTLEFTENPVWYAIQALPYLMEYPYECAEQTFSRFYANSIASHIVNSSPRIKQVFDSWSNSNPDALLSNLEKNQDLKGLILEETPWVLSAQNESERKKRVALLFDLNKMTDELDMALTKLRKMQASNGGWPWFAGMPDDRYITQHIVCGMGKLDHLGVKNIRSDSKTWQMVTQALHYSDQRITEDYLELKSRAKAGKIIMADNHTSYLQIHYLYARSFFNDVITDSNTKEAFNYFLNQARTFWLSNSFYMQGMIALAAKRFNNNDKIPGEILRSFKEKAIHSKELGMYWKQEHGWCWYQAPIETQALMIEAFDEVAKDTVSVNDLKVWLLKQKQTQDWKTTRATTEACFALLLRGTNWLEKSNQVTIKVGQKTVDPATMSEVRMEAGTGYFKTSWNGNDITPDMGTVTITKRDDGVSWGTLYWQYFEQLDKITPAETPLSLKKKLFVERLTKVGPVIVPITDTTHLKTGDLLKVRIELRVDRTMEYVHMKDMRASGLEPVNVISSYKYQDGLGYYESTRDASTNFFFGRLPKGTYVFEYPLRVTHYGNFSNGITSIECMYAPEFASHSEGVRIVVKK